MNPDRERPTGEPGVEAAAGEAVEGEVVDQVVSDDAMRRIFLGMALTVAAAVVVVLFVAAARWAAADEPVEPFGNADIGFLQDMIAHHRQAVVIADTYLAANADGGAAPYAREVILYQERQIERMEAWLAEAGVPSGEPDRQAMTWMGMPVAVAEMPGMQPPAKLDALATARGADADRMFFDIMSDHHLGGAHMADAAAAAARRSEIRQFAAKMADNQRVEVIEYEQAAQRLGLPAG